MTELYYLIESFFFFGVGTNNATGNLLKQIPLKHYFWNTVRVLIKIFGFLTDSSIKMSGSANDCSGKKQHSVYDGFCI